MLPERQGRSRNTVCLSANLYEVLRLPLGFPGKLGAHTTL